MDRADDLALAGANGEFVCTDDPPPCDDPKGTPAWQRALELGAQVNLPRRRERERVAKANRDEAIRRGNQGAAAIADHQAREAGEAARRDHKLLYRGAVRAKQKIVPPLPPARTAPRARGAGRPRASASRSSARSGDSGDDSSGSSSGDGDEPPPPVAAPDLPLAGPSPRFSRPWRPLAERLLGDLLSGIDSTANETPVHFRPGGSCPELAKKVLAHFTKFDSGRTVPAPGLAGGAG